MTPNNEIAVRPSQAPEPALNASLGALVPRSMTEAMETAKMLHASGWFRDLKDAGQALTKIVLGAEMGVSPITAVRGIFVIETQRGPVIQLAGDLEAKLMKAHGYSWTIDRLDAQACDLTVYHGDRELGSVSFTIEQARKAKLTDRPGPWHGFTEDMLFNRAIVRARRRFAPEVTGGLPMPVLEAEEVAETYPDPSDEIMLALFAAFRERCPQSPGETVEQYRILRLNWSTAVLGRKITTWNGPENPNELTRADVQTLLSALEDTTAPQSPRSDTEGAQAGPQPKPGASIPTWARPADSSAGTTAANKQATGADVAPKVGPAPAEPLSAGGERPADSSAGEVAEGRVAETTMVSQATPAEPLSAGVSTPAAGGPKAPAEHIPDEGEGETPDSAAGEAREDRGGEVVVPPEPTSARKPRRKPTTQEFRAAQEVKAETKRQYEERTPIDALPPTFRGYYMEWFGGDVDAAAAKIEEFIPAWTAKGLWPMHGPNKPWCVGTLQDLAEATFESGRQ